MLFPNQIGHKGQQTPIERKASPNPSAQDVGLRASLSVILSAAKDLCAVFMVYLISSSDWLIAFPGQREAVGVNLIRLPARQTAAALLVKPTFLCPRAATFPIGEGFI